MDKVFKKRSKYLIDKDYQLHYMKLVLVQTLVTVFILLAGLAAFSFWPFEPSRQEIFQTFVKSNLTIIIALILMACALQAVVALFLSHKVAGPMYRLKRYLQDISSGADPQQIQFRRGDHLHAVQDAYNEMVMVLEKERVTDLRIVQQLEDGLAHLKKMAREEQVFQLAEYLERLTNDLKNLKTH